MNSSDGHFRSPEYIVRASCRFDNSLCWSFILIAALIQPVKQLNVNAFCTVMFLTVRRHHEFKEIRLCLFVIRPDLTFAVADSSEHLTFGHCQFGYCYYTAPSNHRLNEIQIEQFCGNSSFGKRKDESGWFGSIYADFRIIVRAGVCKSWVPVM